MGTIVGAHLARAGHSVAMIVRERRARQIESDGLRVRGLIEFSTPVATITNPSHLRHADVLIVTPKALDTAAALEPLRCAEIGAALSVQNGVMKNEILAAAFPQAHVLGALANFSGELLASGEVLFTRNNNLMLGDLEAPLSARARKLAAVIDAAGVRSVAVPNIRSQEWSKFAAWVGLVAVSVTTRSVTWKYLIDPGTALVIVRMLREVGALATASGVELTDEAMFPAATMCRVSEAEGVEIIRAQGAQFRDKSPEHRLSTLQDLDARRPMELDETFGYAVERASQLEVGLPLTEAFYSVAKVIDRLARETPA